MAYEIGDTEPPHINVHNEVVSKLAEISAEYDLDLVLPPQRNIGDTEHVKDHNLITDALQAIDDWEAAGGGGDVKWGDFTTNGDETTSNTWGPDAQGRMWKWAEWTVTNNYTVNLTGGMYWVLCCGAGDGGENAQNAANSQGQPGLVNEGYWEFPENPATPIRVGKVGDNNNNLVMGEPSSVGGYGTQGHVGFGSSGGGRGVANRDDRSGYRSSITGVEQHYATGLGYSVLRPGQGGGNGWEQQPGCVIIATAAPNAKALNWVNTTYHAEVNDGTVTAVYTQKHYADGTTTPLPTAELVDAAYGVSEGWLFVDGELQPPPPPPEPTVKERIEALQEQIKELQKDMK